MAGIDRELRDMEEYEMASRAQAEMKMESAARHMQRAFDGLSGSNSEAAMRLLLRTLRPFLLELPRRWRTGARRSRCSPLLGAP